MTLAATGSNAVGPASRTPAEGGDRPMSGLLTVLELERVDRDLFRGQSGDPAAPRVFGGHVIAQALRAAGNTVAPDRPVHSLHAYFTLAGDPRVPIVYQVQRTRDGRSFTTRHVSAVQDGDIIFSMSASFHRPESGPEHQITSLTGVVPGHDETGHPEGDLTHAFPVEVRITRPVGSVDGWEPGSGDSREPRRQGWYRADGRLPDDDPVTHACALAYMSDLGLLGAALPPSGLSWTRGEIMTASLDHAMWFHRPFRADEWVFYDNESPTASAGRALVRGEMYDRSGALVASVVQEGLLRPITR